MTQSEELTKLVEKIQFIYKKSIEEIAISIGYTRPHLSNAMSGKRNVKNVTSALKKKYPGIQDIDVPSTPGGITIINTTDKLMEKVVTFLVQSSSAAAVSLQQVKLLTSRLEGRDFDEVNLTLDKAVSLTADKVLAELQKQ
jgi:hypothetical protein